MSTNQYVDVTRKLQNLENQIRPENAEAIRRFINHQAAEGISEVQQDRQIQSLKTILTRLAPDDFDMFQFGTLLRIGAAIDPLVDGILGTIGLGALAKFFRDLGGLSAAINYFFSIR